MQANYKPAKPLRPETQKLLSAIIELLNRMSYDTPLKKQATMRAYLHYLDISNQEREKEARNIKVTANK